MEQYRRRAETLILLMLSAVAGAILVYLLNLKPAG